MTLQIRPSSSAPINKRMYAPNRDLAYNFPGVVEACLDHLSQADWDTWFGGFLQQAGVSQEDLAVTAKSLGDGFVNFADDNIKSAYEALDAAKFFDGHPAAQLAICAKIGQAMIATYFVAMRDVTLQGADAPVELKQLQESAANMLECLKHRYLQDESCESTK